MNASKAKKLSQCTQYLREGDGSDMTDGCFVVLYTSRLGCGMYVTCILSLACMPVGIKICIDTLTCLDPPEQPASARHVSKCSQ